MFDKKKFVSWKRFKVNMKNKRELAGQLAHVERV